ncbi:MAG: 3-oxocholest-4-en-26-oate---CoA ligase, partial [Actinomycetota bacterium]|nr:3-oxocholest-4-en-26-oate---CoA ligase [Actinomycetota bacterium]
MSRPFADVWEAVADALPDATAQVNGDRRFSWAEMDRRADGVAQTLLDAGVVKQDKVAQYLYNCAEYIESLFGIVKIGCAPVNTNYRYADDELVYLWDNADAVAVVFHGAFTDTIERMRSRVPGVRLWLWVDDGSGPCPDWAMPYEVAAKSATARVVAPWGRSADDLYLLYTGGTTGMPKGVMWRQGDLNIMLNAGNALPVDADFDEIRRIIAAKGPGQVHLPGCPLMHGTGALSSFSAMNAGGCVVTLAGRHFDADELMSTIEREGVTSLAIVGDAFAKPMLRALDDAPGKYDISSIKLVVSSGVMWSTETKDGLLRHHPGMMLSDSLGSSEAIGMGMSMSTAAGGSAQTAKFQLSDRARVVSEDGRWIDAGSGEAGMIALKGPNPIGYYKDEAKTASTFKI